MAKKIVFIGLSHRLNDPRLMHREMKTLTGSIDNIEVYFVKIVRCEEQKGLSVKTEDVALDNGKLITNISVILPSSKGLLSKMITRLRGTLLLVRTTRGLKPEVIQASDARELPLAVMMKLFLKSKLVYDSHEDYYRQALDYGGKSLRSFFSALRLQLSEMLFVRFFKSVFCTDEFLLSKYSKSFYGAKEVNLLRNFPYVDERAQERIKLKDFSSTNELKLVYIGGVNKFRGIIECAQYCRKFNEEFRDKQVSFDVYSPPNEITEDLCNSDLITHYPWTEYEVLMRLLSNYDVGICLWLPIEKFHRNLPLKNFDYMGVGLPIITSNFGNLKKYVEIPRSGICVDPTDYTEFKNALLTMFKPENRKTYSMNGIIYTSRIASFQVEAKAYVKAYKRLLETQ